MESKDLAVELGPFVHLAEFDVTHHVVDTQDTCLALVNTCFGKAWKKWPLVIFVGDQRVNRIAIRVYCGSTNCAMRVDHFLRLHERLCSAPDSFFEGKI